MILVVDFMGNAVNSFQEPPASVCYYSAWMTVFTREYSECFQKSLFSSGLTYLWLKN